jgi:hypothetical protein
MTDKSGKPVWKPILSIDPAFGRPRIVALLTGLREISNNVEYVLNELPTACPGVELRRQIDRVFRDFHNCLYDVRPEIPNLADKLGLNPGQPPNDPDIANPDPRVTIGFIRNWLQREFDDLHVLVQKLGADRGKPEVGLMFTLVAESAANMLNAFVGMLVALEEVEAAVAPLLSGPPRG